MDVARKWSKDCASGRRPASGQHALEKKVTKWLHIAKMLIYNYHVLPKSGVGSRRW